MPIEYLPIGIIVELEPSRIGEMSQDEFNKKDFLRRLGKRIAKVRASKGYSQDRLSLEADIARGTMSKIEAGLRDPRSSTLYRIADVLEIPVGKFFELKP